MSMVIRISTGEDVPLLWVPPGGERRRARKSEMDEAQREAMRIHERDYDSNRRVRGKRRGVHDNGDDAA